MSRYVKKAAALALATALCLSSGLSAGCYTQKFDVGTGATGTEKQEFQQWFILWGLVELTKVEDDVESYAADAGGNYTVTTQFTPLDVLIGIFTNIVTIGPKTITVEK